MSKRRTKKEKLITITNTSFYSFEDSRKILIEKSVFPNIDESEKETAIDSILAKTFKTKSIITIDGSEYKLIEFGNYSNFKRTTEDKERTEEVLSIQNINGRYSISTGIYCGTIKIDDEVSITITCGLSDLFFKRILNFCCGIYADVSNEDESSENLSIYSLIVQYMYLMSLRKVMHKTFPKKYIEKKERGFSINGEIDIENYINEDIFSFDRKITYAYSDQIVVQPIIDVLYYAFTQCTISKKCKALPDTSNFGCYLKENYSGSRPSIKTVNGILKEKCLFNSLYADFKKPLEYAKIVLNSKELNKGNGAKNTLGNFLIDSSFLWENYLYNLMLIHLKDYEINFQSKISFYDETFFKKDNYPDFVITNKSNGKVAVFDAKFKKMTYSNFDVDNGDIRQLHSYSYYFSMKYGERFIGAALIYPTNSSKPKDTKSVDNMCGIAGTDTKFGIFAVKDPCKGETIIGNELAFIDEIKNFLEE